MATVTCKYRRLCTRLFMALINCKLNESIAMEFGNNSVQLNFLKQEYPWGFTSVYLNGGKQKILSNNTGVL